LLLLPQIRVSKKLEPKWSQQCFKTDETCDDKGANDNLKTTKGKADGLPTVK